MQKWESKNGGTEPENQGPEPQSARAGAVETHFCIFWENPKLHRFFLSISASFFSLLFCIIFEPFPETSKKTSRVGPQSHKNTSKWTPGAPKRSPRISKLSPKVPLSPKNLLNCPARVAQWSPKCYNGVPRPPKVQKKHEKGVQSANKARICAASAKKRTSTHRP